MGETVSFSWTGWEKFETCQLLTVWANFLLSNIALICRKRRTHVCYYSPAWQADRKQMAALTNAHDLQTCSVRDHLQEGSRSFLSWDMIIHQKKKKNYTQDPY